MKRNTPVTIECIKWNPLAVNPTRNKRSRPSLSELDEAVFGTFCRLPAPHIFFFDSEIEATHIRCFWDLGLGIGDFTVKVGLLLPSPLGEWTLIFNFHPEKEESGGVIFRLKSSRAYLGSDENYAPFCSLDNSRKDGSSIRPQPLEKLLPQAILLLVEKLMEQISVTFNKICSWNTKELELVERQGS